MLQCTSNCLVTMQAEIFMYIGMKQNKYWKVMLDTYKKESP